MSHESTDHIPELMECSGQVQLLQNQRQLIADVLHANLGQMQDFVMLHLIEYRAEHNVRAQCDRKHIVRVNEQKRRGEGPLQAVAGPLQPIVRMDDQFQLLAHVFVALELVAGDLQRRLPVDGHQQLIDAAIADDQVVQRVSHVKQYDEEAHLLDGLAAQEAPFAPLGQPLVERQLGRGHEQQVHGENDRFHPKGPVDAAIVERHLDQCSEQHVEAEQLVEEGGVRKATAQQVHGNKAEHVHVADGLAQLQDAIVCDRR